MKKLLAVVSMVMLVGILFISTAYAEMTFNYGASERIRQEIWDNLLDLGTLPLNNTDKDRNFFRFKTSLWGSADLNKDLNVYLKLTSEVYYNLGGYKQPSDTNKFVHLDENEAVVDNLYVKANNVFGLPVDLKVGRQDFLGPDMYGEGFLILDGTPNDGSRTFYFNAARARWRINQNHSIDLVYITDQFEDEYLPTIRTDVPNAGTYFGDKKILNASNEQGFVVYGRDKLSEKLTLEPYYIYKSEESFVFPAGAAKPLNVTPELNLHTIGARALYQDDSWKLGGEFAHQFGEYDGGRDRSGYGGYIFASKKFANVKFTPEVELRYVYLSGDDPKTKTDENWDPLFSRAPYWNELLIYTQIYETVKEGYAIPGYWTNSQLFMVKATMDFSPDTKLALSYQYWRANETADTLAPFKAMFGTGRERGHLPTVFLTHKFNKNIDGFFQYEYFVPGDFYAAKARDGQFLRWQLQFKI